jgi:hypothetical protein
MKEALGSSETSVLTRATRRTSQKTPFFMWMNYFSQISGVRSVSDIRQREVHTLQTLILDDSPFKVGGACGSIVVKALFYKPEGHGFETR